MYPSVAYDPQLGGVVLFGGINNRSPTSSTPAFNDTWLFANGTWTNISDEFASAPPARWAASFTWDALDGYMVLFGGRTGGTATVVPRFLNDTWTLSSTGWTPISTSLSPPARGFAPFAYDPSITATLLFSGGDIDFSNGTIAPFHDTWTYATGVWTNITSTAGAGAGQASSMTYDPNAGGVIATGIMRPNSICAPLNQTWLFAGGVWTKLLNTSSPLPGGNLAYDSLLGKLFYVGGCIPANHTPLPLTWEYANGTWTNDTAVLGSLQGTTCCSGLAYDPVQKIVLLYGGNRVHPSAKVGYVNWAYSYPVAALAAPIHADRTRGSTPFTVQLGALRTGGLAPYTFSWNFNDGSPLDSTQNTSHTFSTLGAHVVDLTVSDSGGRMVNQSITLTVGPTYSLFAALGPLAGEAPLPVNFTAVASGGFTPYTYAWNFSDGSFATQPNGTHTYAAGGTYTAVLNATDAAGDFLTFNSTIAVTSAVTAVVDRSPTVGVAPLPVVFTATPIGGLSPYTYNWSYGDGSTGTGAVVSHTYSSVGDYVASLTISDGWGRSAIITSAVSVVAPLTASASVGPGIGAAPVVASFTATPHGGLAPYAYSWTFGDGNGGTGASVSHSYPSAGNYTASVTITDALNESTTATTSVLVVSPLSVSTNASIIAAAPATVTFAPTLSGGYGPFAYAWTFGDGSTGSGSPVSHTYASAGPYTASVHVTDGLGEVASNSTIVTVVRPLSVVVATNLSSVDVGGAVSFTATASDGYGSLTYAWSGLPSGCTAGSTSTFTCSPSAAGSFNVSVRVTDGLGESATASTTLTVTSSSASSGGLFSGGLLLILVGIVVVLLIIAVLAVLLLRRPKRPAPVEAAGSSGPIERTLDEPAELGDSAGPGTSEP